MKKFLAYALMVLCYWFPNIISTVLNSLYSTAGAMIISFVITVMSGVLFAFTAFYVPQKFVPSENGLRYKVLSIFAILCGVVAAVSAMRIIDENATLFDIFVSIDMLGFMLAALLNTAFIFGVTLFVLYKRNYKNDRKNSIE